MRCNQSRHISLRLDELLEEKGRFEPLEREQYLDRVQVDKK
jgi:hypothetical protein